MLTADLHAQALLKRIQHGYDLRLMQRTVGLAQQPDTGLVGMVGDDAVTGHPTQQVVQIVVCDRFKGQEMLFIQPAQLQRLADLLALLILHIGRQWEPLVGCTAI